MNEDIAIKDIEKSVKVGEGNQVLIIKLFLDWLATVTPDCHLRAYEFPKMSDIDYIVTNHNKVLCQVEIKARSKYWDLSMIPTRKEIKAVDDWTTTRIKTFYVAYYLDVKKIYVYNLTKPPVKRAEITRWDRGISGDYSFYDSLKAIYLGGFL